MCDLMDIGYDKLVALHGHCLVKRQQICLPTWYYASNMPPGELEIKEKSYLTDAPPSDMPTNTVSRLLHCQYNKHAK